MTDNDKPNFAIIVGAAGDWTRSLVESVSEGLGPEKMWIRGVNPPGFMTMHRTFYSLFLADMETHILGLSPSPLEPALRLASLRLQTNRPTFIFFG